LVGALLFFSFLYLLGELFIVKRDRGRLPLRIAVTGTRGKSSLTRLLAACLKEAGFKVLAKTTGSRAVIIFPDGQQEEIRRSGSATILEQKSLLKIGAELKVDSLVCELMSINPESAFIESVRLLKPHILVITNVRPDHLAQMGSNREEIASNLAASIPENSTVFVPKAEFFSVFKRRAEKMKAKIVQVTTEAWAERIPSDLKLSYLEFRENFGLALAVADHLGLKEKTAWAGMAKVQPDLGSFKTWKISLGPPVRRLYLANAFAANDPQSTRQVVAKLLEKRELADKRITALLNFRRDRGDRTFQWLKALNRNAFPEIDEFYLAGAHTHAFLRKVKDELKSRVKILTGEDPEEITGQITSGQKEEILLIGMVNMGGLGREMVNYWQRVAEPYDL